MIAHRIFGISVAMAAGVVALVVTAVCLLLLVVAACLLVWGDPLAIVRGMDQARLDRQRRGAAESLRAWRTRTREPTHRRQHD